MVNLMKRIIDFLNKKKVEYDLGVYENNYFYMISNSVKANNAIRFKWKKDGIDKLIINLQDNGIELEQYEDVGDIIIYTIKDTDLYLVIVLAINSHVQLPQLLLKNFRTGDYLYYLNTTTNEIKKDSAKQYNTKFGHYSISFEAYLNENYEKIIKSLIEEIDPFAKQEVSTVTINNLTVRVNKLFFMAIARNPKYIKEINEESTSAILLENGYTSENLFALGERMKYNFIKGYKPIIIVNYTQKNFVTLKSLVSSLSINGGNKCMALLLHPKFAIALVPNVYYKELIKEQGNQTYFRLDDEKTLIETNKQIYRCAKNNREDIIGIKSDLEDLKKG